MCRNIRTLRALAPATTKPSRADADADAFEAVTS